MSYRVTASETATRRMRRLQKEARDRITRGLRVLEEDPFRHRPRAGIQPLEGTDPRKYRIRIGDYRAGYAVAGTEVKVIEIFVRGRGYL